MDNNSQRKIKLAEELYREFDHICFTYRVKLVPPVIRTQTMSGRWGLWDPITRTLSLSETLIATYPWDVVIEILKHEMAHQMVTDHFRSDEAHGPLFQEACRRLGVAPWASQAETDLNHPITPWQKSALSPEEDKLVRRVEKLLALATSSNEHESLAAMQKVQELYAKHNLSRIEERRQSQHVYLTLNTKKKRLQRHYFMIASILNEHFFVRVIHSELFDASSLTKYKVIELLGTRENVLMAEYVYHFLLNQIHFLWRGYQKQHAKAHTARQSYFLGILSGFRDKLDAAKAADTSQDSTGRALALSEDPQLESFVTFRYPRLVSFRRGRSVGCSESFQAGQQEGWKLVIHKGISQQEGDQGRFLPRESR